MVWFSSKNIPFSTIFFSKMQGRKILWWQMSSYVSVFTWKKAYGTISLVYARWYGHKPCLPMLQLSRLQKPYFGPYHFTLDALRHGSPLVLKYYVWQCRCFLYIYFAILYFTVCQKCQGKAADRYLSKLQEIYLKYLYDANDLNAYLHSAVFIILQT